MGGLEQLRDQFHRCWSFVKQNHKAGRDRPTSLENQATQPSTSTPPAATPKDQFSLSISKNTTLRVEDLKPPPPKRRLTSSAQSPPAASSPATSAFASPQTDIDSPPKSEAQIRSTAARGGKAPAKPRKKEPTKAGAKGEPANAPSPMQAPTPTPAPNHAVAEEQLSLKRKREQDEIEQDPDSFIERTLRGLDRPLSSSFIAKDLTSHLAFDFDPVIPGVQDLIGDPLSFAVGSSGDPFPGDRPPPAFSSAQSAALQDATTPAFDFDFFIDSTAAGFDLDPPAETPELVGATGEASPPSDDDAPPPAVVGSNYSSKPLYPPAISGGEYEGAGVEGVEDYDKWVNSGEYEYGLPPGFSWEGDLGPRGVWNIYEG